MLIIITALATKKVPKKYAQRKPQGSNWYSTINQLILMFMAANSQVHTRELSSHNSLYPRGRRNPNIHEQMNE